jgi:hypothetical protein
MTATQLQLFTDPITLDQLATVAAQIQDQDAPDVIAGDLGGRICEARAGDYLFQARMIHREFERHPYSFTNRDKLRKLADVAKWEVLYALYFYAAQIRQGITGAHQDAATDLNGRLQLYELRTAAFRADIQREKHAWIH